MKRIIECYIQISPDEIYEKSSTNPYNNIVPFSIEAIFNWRANALVDYIWRRLRESEVYNENFSKISIHLCKNPKSGYRLFENILIYEIFFDEKKYREFNQFNKNEIQEFIVNQLKTGIENLYKLRKDIPKDILLEILKEFKENNYENNWILKTKKLIINDVKYQLLLECEEDMNRFVLYYRVYNEFNKIIFEKELLKTIPSQTFYTFKIKKFKFLPNKLIFSCPDIEKFSFESLLVLG